MHWPLFVAQHLSTKKQKSFSKSVVRLAIIAVALSSAFMIITLGTVRGFQNTIKDKVIGINGHVLVHHAANDKGSEPIMLPVETVQYQSAVNILAKKFQAHSFRILQKPGILKSETELEGVVVKGVEDSYTFDFFKKLMVKGRVPQGRQMRNEALISQTTARRMGLDTGYSLKVIFFVEDSNGNKSAAKAIAPKIVGIFNTGMEEYDRTLVITHRKQLLKLLPDTSLFTSWEFNLNEPRIADSLAYHLSLLLPADKYLAETVNTYHAEIFDWLNILDTNVIIILVLMTLVACINMSTTLLILVTNRANMVGILKAMGAQNRGIKWIFIYQSLGIAFIGLLLGNLLGLGLGMIQNTTEFLKLPEEIYYLDHVIIHFNFWEIIAVNAGTLIICMFVLYLPATIISRLTPVKTIRFN